MKFTLTQYQEEAVRAVLDNLRKARKRWHEDTEKHAFSLTAATGAGKTVMAGAVFEALFYGNSPFSKGPLLSPQETKVKVGIGADISLKVSGTVPNATPLEILLGQSLMKSGFLADLIWKVKASFPI